MTGLKRKLFSAMLAILIVGQTTIPTVFAEVNTESTKKTIVSIDSLEQTEYTLSIGADEQNIKQVLSFPTEINAQVGASGSENNEVTENVKLPVTWTSDNELSTNQEGIFTYTAALLEAEKDNYVFGNDVSLPKIIVTVKSNKTMDAPKIKISGTQKFGEQLTVTIENPPTDSGNINYLWSLMGMTDSKTFNTQTITIPEEYVNNKIEVKVSYEKNYLDSIVSDIEIGKANSPAAPTYSAIDDTKGTDTFTFTTVEGFTDITLYEYSMDGGNTWKAVSINPISVGNVAGTIQVRIKETTTHEVGEIYVHNIPFTASVEGDVFIDKTSGIEYGDILNATTNGIQSGAELHYQWKADTENIGTDSKTLTVPSSAIGKTISVLVTSTNYPGELTSSATNVVSKKNVTAKSGNASKEYDGMDTASVNLSIDKVNQEDEVLVMAPNAKFDNPSVGKDKSIILGELTVNGTAADWYIVSAPTSVVGTITQKTLTDVTVTVEGSYSYTGTAITPMITVKNGEIILVKGTDYNYLASNNINVGEAAINVTFIGNYSGTAVEKFMIKQKEVMPTIDIISDQIFTGIQLMPEPVVKDNSTILTKDIDYTVTYGENIDAGTNAGSVVVTLKGNYVGTKTENFNINKGTVHNVTAPDNILMVMGQERAYTFDLSTIVIPQNAGTVTYEVGNPSDSTLFSKEPAVDGKMLSFTSANVNSVGAKTTAVVTIISSNYNNVEVTLTFEIENKIPVTISGVGVDSKIYNGEAVIYTGTPITSEGETVVSTSGFDYVWSKVSGEVLTEAPKNAGNYKLTISVKDTDSKYIGSMEIAFSIEKAMISIEAESKNAHVGDKKPELTYIVKGIVTGDKLQVEPKLNTIADMTAVGSYEIIASEAVVPNTENYDSNITYKAATLTISAKPTSGGGGSSNNSSSNSSSDSATVITPQITTENPNPSTEAVVTVKSSISNDTATIDVTESMVNNAISKAQAEAKIIAVADAVDVMLHGRHYCDNKEIEVINIELNNNKNLQFDATVAQAMIEIMELNSDFEFKFDNSQMIKCYV